MPLIISTIYNRPLMVAVRVQLYNIASSPNTLPGPNTLTFRPFLRTSTRPSIDATAHCHITDLKSWPNTRTSSTATSHKNIISSKTIHRQSADPKYSTDLRPQSNVPSTEHLFVTASLPCICVTRPASSDCRYSLT